jgi:competence protein ComQ
MSLMEFLERVDARLDAAVLRPEFELTQRKLLLETVGLYRPAARANPIYDPLSRATFYFIVRAGGRAVDEQVELIAAFTSLYVLAADLMDDVEDEDLAGKPHERVGAAVATNDAVALLFLALDALQHAIELEPDTARRFAYYRILNRVSVTVVAGQHRDLTGHQEILSPSDVLGVYMAKSSSTMSMITECAALLAGHDEAQRARYRRLGECFALLLQIRDDIRDVFGRTASPDLSLGRVTYPIACFLEQADARAKCQFARLSQELPESIGQIRALLYEQGTITACAEAMEQFRNEIHEILAATGNHSAPHRCLLWIVDGLAESIYHLPDIEASRPILEPHGPWHDLVRCHFEQALGRMATVVGQTPPKLRPWHLPQWMYAPDRQTIYYPDIEGLAEETLPFQAQLLGTGNLDEVAVVLHKQVPALVAHEMFHFLRHASERMTGDHWHEEWAANRLAVAYLRRFEPSALAASLEVASRILARYPLELDQRAEQVLRDAHQCRPNAQAGYDMDITSIAIVGLEMVRRLAMEPIDFDAAVAELLTPPTRQASAVAA